MEWVRKIESYFQTPKVSTQKALNLLVAAIAECGKVVELSHSGLRARAQLHIGLAEEHHAFALKHFQSGEFNACQKQIEQSSMRVQMAQELVNAHEGVELDSTGSLFDFSDPSIEFLLNHLLNSIAKTKLVVESSNLHVNQKAQDSLFESVKVAKHALSALKNEEFDEAKNFSLTSMLLLARVCSLLSLENEQSTWQIDFPESACPESVNQIRRLIDEMAACRRLIADAGITNSAKIERHFKEAEERFNECLVSVTDHEYYFVENAVVVAMSELQLCQKLAQHATYNSELDDDEGAFSAERSFKSLEVESAKIVRIAQKNEVRDMRSFQRRMESSVVYFGRAAFQFKGNQMQEALRLATAAYLDLDFAWQIAMTSSKPEYREADFLET